MKVYIVNIYIPPINMKYSFFIFFFSNLDTLTETVSFLTVKTIYIIKAYLNLCLGTILIVSVKLINHLKF